MGLVHVMVEVANPFDLARAESIELLVDTGVVPSVIPRPLLERIGIAPQGTRKFRLADGRDMERSYGEARVRLAGEEATTRVVFGEPEDATVLGVLALESMGVSVDPSSGEIRREDVQ